MTKNACMIVHAYYPSDPRVRREAEALLEVGWIVDIICLRGQDERSTEVCGGARVHRLPVRRHRGSGLAMYLLEYLSFFLLAALRVARLHLQHHYGVVQVHNMPDFLVFTALLPRLLGARVVLDIHDLVPELYMQKFGGRLDHPLIRIVRSVERISIAFADHVITAGKPFRYRLISRNVSANKVTVIMNSADPKLFHPIQHHEGKLRKSGFFTLMYHGGLFERYGLDIAIKAVGRLRDEIPRLRFLIYGQGEAADDLKRLIEERDLGEQVKIGEFVPLDGVPKVISAADLGVVPYRRNPFTDMLFPTKAFEYIVMGIPVILARTQSVVELFGDIPDMFFQPDDVDDLAERILTMYQEPKRRQYLLDSARRAYAPYVWENQREEYLMLMRRLTTARGGMPNLEVY